MRGVSGHSIFPLRLERPGAWSGLLDGFAYFNDEARNNPWLGFNVPAMGVLIASFALGSLLMESSVG